MGVLGHGGARQPVAKKLAWLGDVLGMLVVSSGLAAMLSGSVWGALAGLTLAGGAPPRDSRARLDALKAWPAW
jgi:hypothetical protein